MSFSNSNIVQLLHMTFMSQWVLTLVCFSPWTYIEWTFYYWDNHITSFLYRTQSSAFFTTYTLELSTVGAISLIWLYVLARYFLMIRLTFYLQNSSLFFILIRIYRSGLAWIFPELSFVNFFPFSFSSFVITFLARTSKYGLLDSIIVRCFLLLFILIVTFLGSRTIL